MATEEYPLKLTEIWKHYRIVRDYLCRICLEPFERYEDDDMVCEECDEDGF
jgi:hypothetical protein